MRCSNAMRYPTPSIAPRTILPSSSRRRRLRPITVPMRRRTAKSRTTSFRCSRARFRLVRAQTAPGRPKPSRWESRRRRAAYPCFALERGGDMRREFFGLAGLACRRLGLEGRHHLGGKKLKCLADVVVAVAAGLLQEDDLIDAAVLEHFQMRAHVGRRADAGRVGADPLGGGNDR